MVYMVAELVRSLTKTSYPFSACAMSSPAMMDPVLNWKKDATMYLIALMEVMKTIVSP